MKKYKITASISIIAVVLGIYLLSLTWFVTLYPPLKIYNFPFSIQILEHKMSILFEENDKYNFIITDKTGNYEADNAFYGDLIIKVLDKDYKYNLKYFKSTTSSRTLNMTKIELIGAFDMSKNYGGYKADDSEINKLIAIFHNEFIKKIALSER